MSWDENPDPWHTVELGGETLPGIWEARMTNGVARQVEVKKARGEDGHVITDQGAVGPEVVLLGDLTSNQWEQYKAIIPTINPRKPGGLKTPVTIVHPLPNAHGIDKVYVNALRPFSPDSSRFMRIEIHCVQWFPQPKATKSKKDVNGANKPAPSRYNEAQEVPGAPGGAQDVWGEPMSVSPDYIQQSYEPLWTPL